MKSAAISTRTAARACAALVAIAFSCVCALGAGPWVPFVAQRIAKTYRLSASGKNLTRETSEVWLRNSAGSTYLRNTVVFGSSPPGASERAMLFDALTGTTYVIDYGAKTVRVMRKGSPPAPPSAASFEKNMANNQPVKQKAVAGVACMGWKMGWSGSAVHTRGEPAGEAWFAPSLNFLPLATVMVDRENGVEIDTAVVSIQPGREPNPKLFLVPSDFARLN